MRNHIRLEDHSDEAGGDYRLLTPAESAAVTAAQARSFPVLARGDNPIVAQAIDGRYITAAGLDWHLAQRADDDEADPTLWG